MADLVKILIFLFGSAVIGFFLGRRSRNPDVAAHQHVADEQRRAYTEVKSKLDRCTSKRAGLERELAQLQQGKSSAKPAAAASKSSTTKVTTAPAPKSKAPIPPKKKEAKKAKPQSASSKQDDAIKRIQAKANQINFDRIGRASAEEKDDLKRIKGVGPFLEKKLNALGIYTFGQIANFTDEDKEKVNDAIEFFPGRISRDNWVDQAKSLQKENT